MLIRFCCYHNKLKLSLIHTLHNLFHMILAMLAIFFNVNFGNINVSYITLYTCVIYIINAQICHHCSLVPTYFFCIPGAVAA
jgi:hypothetical protein